MDIPSYLLGKKASGGGGTSSIDWSAIGYNSIPNSIQTGYDYALQIKENWDSTQTSYDFGEDINLRYMPLVDISNATNLDAMFTSCTNLESIALLDTSNVTSMGATFMDTALTTIPQFDTSNVTNMSSMLSSCLSLRTVPELNAQKISNIKNVFKWSSGIINFGGFKNLGQAYSTNAASSTSEYTLDISESKNLTHESLMNVINNLYDIATKGVQTQKLVLGTTNLAKLTAEEIAIATEKGWTVS